jgi:transcriptional antiterminator NusG
MPEESSVSEPVPASDEPKPAENPPAAHADESAAPAEEAPPAPAADAPAEAPAAPSSDVEAPAEAPAAAADGNGAPAVSAGNKRWYVVKVQSGREESIKEAIERRVKIEGLEEYFGQILIPTEKVVEMRQNKRVTRQRKLFPGYLMVEVEYNDRILYLFRETSGVGDFVGGSVNHPPPPMAQHEIDKLTRAPSKGPREVPPKDKFDRGDRVKVKDGPFAGMEGEVKEILDAKDKIRVELTIFGRPVPVELEYWAVEKS